ncbi:TIGR02281 family clan AA aspartic protease [Methylobacterium sp. WL116]|uniref:retropepsin-like aspartic protease family protein n=1 Tax=Methylobacterium sp. WL116 TaxID=2603889 RepID=UPI0011CAD8EB|nr:TIGR02281 family clan AA aspartic protease [Methylobacterium sp. WL116]TXM88333.1 TIGR02281 family clan AA aspartic protease [Methylobacterium sp. WL116]
MTIIALIAIGLVVAVLVATDGGRIAGAIEPDQLAGLAWGAGILALVVAGFWRQFAGAPGKNLQALLLWCGLGLACIVGYVYREPLQEVGARVTGALRPGSPTIGPGGTVTITRRSDGAFLVEAQVDGRSQSFAFDTGASAVVLTAENAAALGLHPEPGAFTVRVATANGIAYAAPTTLDALAIGPITERRVPALVAKPGALDGNLLGQSFLTRLAGYEVRGDRLILRGR